MTDLKVSDYLVENYENYYQESEIRWRELGAIDKCSNIQQLCSELPHRTILEIGAGDGSILKRLAELGFGEKLFALEIVPNAVSKINQLGIPTLAECKLFDGYHIPYEDNSFDLVILSHVLEHAEYPRKLVYEASQVAKNVFIEVPLEDTIKLPPNFTFTKTGHINAYSPKTIRRLIMSCRMEILQQVTTNPSKEVLVYRYGKKGLLQFYLREIMLKVFPKLATQLFTYHLALTYKKA
jgi:SAM-dependent methyltransferase